MECVDGRATSEAPTRILIGEPVIRPDGVTVSLYRNYDELELCLEKPSVPGTLLSSRHYYKDSEVAIIGDGDWKMGLARIAQAGYQRPNYDNGRPDRDFDDFLRAQRGQL